MFMLNKSKDAREQGFKAGLVFGARCPYPANTNEAKQWELGWIEGVLKRTGHDCSEAGVDSSELWYRFTQRLCGH